jgi:hypothetical protein
MMKSLDPTALSLYILRSNHSCEFVWKDSLQGLHPAQFDQPGGHLIVKTIQITKKVTHKIL